MREKISDITQRANSFLRDVGQEAGVSGQWFIAGLLCLGLLVSILFHKSLFVAAIILEFLSLLWYVLAKGVAEGIKNAARPWVRLNMFLTGALIGMAPYCLLVRALGQTSGAMAVIAAASVLTMEILVTVLQFGETGKEVWGWLDKASVMGLGGVDPVYKQGDVVLCDDKEKLEAGEKDPREIIPYKDRFLHMLILGPTGGGKTSQVILPMVNQDIHNLEAGVTVIEPKGDLAREVAMMAKDLGRPYLYFDPSVDNCPFFNPLVGDETDVIENAVTTFLMLNPDSPQYFKDLSEQLVRNSLKVLKRLDRYNGVDGNYSTFIWMSRLLQNAGGRGRELVQKFVKTRAPTEEEAKENADIASWFLNEYFAERSKVYENSSGIRSQVSKVTKMKETRWIRNRTRTASKAGI